MTSRASALPSISRLLDLPAAVAAVDHYGHAPVVEALRDVVEQARRTVLADGEVPGAAALVEDAVAALARGRRARTRRVVNATGVVLHTNLGRAPLSDAATAAMQAAAGYTNLEYDLDGGGRGGRGAYAADLLARACGAEAACVVNNGAAALVLAVAGLAPAEAREVVVSRGELIEIGGSFRLPELLAAAGVTLREVGTTNRTHAHDYAAALGERTGLVLQVHPSNYRLVGFVARPTTDELAPLAQAAGVPLVVDVGSGLLDDRDAALADEPVPSQVLAAGADLVVFSGDKLLGGPQAGVVAGRAELVDRCRRHPLARAMRIDKFRLAALEATLEDHLAGTRPPARAMLADDPERLHARARALAERVGGDVVEVRSVAGGGSLPALELPSSAVALDGAPDVLLAALRGWDPPVVARIVDDRVVLDVRTLAAADEDVVAAAVAGLRRERRPDRDRPGGTPS